MKRMSMASMALMLLLAVAAWGQSNTQAVKITNGPTVAQPAGGVAEVDWSTNVQGSSVVKYGTSQNALNQSSEAAWGGEKQPNGDYTHRVWLKNLRPNTTYYYTIDTGQGQGTGTEAQSQVKQFHTINPK
jgi:phosphodiesterase/alkaline phosphatase D-like protein